MPFFSAALIALPFLFPWVAGPSVNVWQLLCAWACIAFLLFSCDARGKTLDRRVLGWLMLSAGCIALFHGDVWGFWVPACTATAAVAVAALIGARMSSAAQGAVALAWGVLAAGLVSAVLGLLQYYGLAEPLVPWTTSPALGQAYGNLRQ
ncbi:polymerase, partial [Variovorax sp. RHLX14]